MMDCGSRFWMMLSICILAFGASSLDHAAAYGKSVEDLVGAFSIEKTIRLGDSSCFEGQSEADPLNPDFANMASQLANGSMSDAEAPSLAGFDFQPKEVNTTSSSQAINFSAHILDDQSGFIAATAWFFSPSVEKMAKVLFYPENLTSGSPRDGIYSARMILPACSEKGIWLLDNLTLVDGRGNSRVLQRTDLMASALPAEVLVA